MRRELQEIFFSLFRTGGVLDTSISVIKRKNDLNYLPQTKPLDDRDLRLINQQSRSLDERYKKLDDTTLYPLNLIFLLINEIEDNFLSRSRDTDKNNYMLSIITEFKIFSDIIYHDLYYPNAHKVTIDNLSDGRKMWLEARNSTATVQQAEVIDEQLEAIEYLLNTQYPEREKRAKNISEYFWGFSQLKYDEDLIENRVFSLCWHLYHQFAHKFDALCLRYGLDLLKLQNECNVYLIHSHDISLLREYIGSQELAERYLNDINGIEHQLIEEKEVAPSQSKFEDYLTKEGKRAITSIRNNYQGAKGKALVILLYALYDLDFLNTHPTNINQTHVFDSLKLFLGDIGSRQGFNTQMTNYNVDTLIIKPDIEKAKRLISP